MTDTLAAQVAAARTQVAQQHDPALTDAYSADELAAERELAEYRRSLDRDGRRADATTAAAAAARVRKVRDTIAALELRDELAAAQALAAHRRAASPTAQLADLHRYRVWAGRALGGVVVAGMCWSAVNVQHNIAPGAAISDPLYWFSYLIEAMISACLIVVMAGAPRLAAHGITVSRRTLTAAELALLALTVALNTYPHVRAGDWYDAAVHAVAPGMIAVALAIHHAMSSRVAAAMAAAARGASVQVDAHAPTAHPAAAPSAPAPAPAAPPVHPAPAAGAPAPAAAPAPQPAPAPVHVHATRPVRDLAAEIIATGTTKAPADTVAAVIAAADADTEEGHPPRHTRIAKATGLHHATVKRIITAAAAIRGPGATVITLHATGQH